MEFVPTLRKPLLTYGPTAMLRSFLGKIQFHVLAAAFAVRDRIVFRMQIDYMAFYINSFLCYFMYFGGKKI
jgi:hypothetical protein